MLKIYQNLVTMMILLTNWALSQLNITTTDRVIVFKQGITDVKAKVDKINLLRQMLNITGTAADKKNLRNILCDITISITYPVRAWAFTNKNGDLYDKVKTSRSSFFDMSAAHLVATVNALYTTILPLLPQLTEAGIALTDSDFELMINACNSFNNITTAPQAGIQNRKSINKTINDLVKEANQICHIILDNNIVSFNSLDKTYVQEYYIKRKVTPLGVRHTRLLANLSTDLGPCINCTVTVNAFTKEGKTYKPASAITDINGNCIISTFESGIRSVTLSGDSIETTTIENILFENGKTMQRDFVCAPKFNGLPASKVETPTEKVSK